MTAKNFHCAHAIQTLFTVIFFASFREFVRVVKEKASQWWAKHRHQADGEMSLTALHDDEGIVSLFLLVWGSFN